uniref:NADH-ubiquinone oxidoreductase chain 6 n=1 Tax=Toxarium undulatum TaxID=210620 RepID=A0A2U9GIT0_9STRA|nr:NADH dehydrogenase subunit 6 [Toxarium undulatum]AWQ64132.1 NADH dehydrogenase subunit 6 [Toxarium undulatum]
MIINGLYIFFSLSLILNASLVIVSKNSVHSAFFLILSFISASSIIVLLECEYIAILFLTIYVGAVAILFVFVTMMLNIKENKQNFGYSPRFLFGLGFGGFFFLEIFYLLLQSFSINFYSPSDAKNSRPDMFWYCWDIARSFADIDIYLLGQVLYSHYAVQFLMAGSILLLAALGSVVLSVNYNKKNLKYQNTFKQISRQV